jgi:hypothetical protein
MEVLYLKNKFMYQMFLEMMNKMSDEEIEAGLKKAEGMMSPEELDQLREFIKENKKNK